MGTTTTPKSGRTVSSQAHDAAATLSPDEARAIAKEAYIYGFPLVDSYRIQHSYFVDRGGKEYKAPWNQLYNSARVYTPEDRAIQTPNSDTPYSFVGADLRTEPLVIDVPAVGDDRYYSLQFIDAYTFNFAYVGSRTTGNGEGAFLLAGPTWSGETPAGIDDVIRCETEFAFILFRTQLFGPDDIENVKRVQAGYAVRTLSQFLGAQCSGRCAGGGLSDAAHAAGGAHLDRVLPPAELRAPVLSRASLRASAARAARKARYRRARRVRCDELVSGGAGGRRAGDGRCVEELRRLQVEQDRHRQDDARTDRDAGVPEEQLHVSDGRRGARDLRELERGGAVSDLLRGCRRPEARRKREPLRAALRGRSIAAGECLLVADHLRAPGKSAGGEPDRPLPHQLVDAAGVEARRGRRRDDLRAARLAGPRARVQLAARAERSLPRGDAAVLAEGRRAERHMEAATTPAREHRAADVALRHGGELSSAPSPTATSASS